MTDKINSLEWGRERLGELYDRWPKDASGEPEPPDYLTHCSGVDMADTMIIALLDAYGIPALRQYAGNGAFGKLILGISGEGVDIFVPASRLQEAQEFLAASPGDEDEIGGTAPNEGDDHAEFI